MAQSIELNYYLLGLARRSTFFQKIPLIFMPVNIKVEEYVDNKI